MLKFDEYGFMAKMADQTKIDKWKLEQREANQRLLVEPAETMLICLGGEGGTFSTRWCDDSLDMVVPTVFLREPGFDPVRATKKITVKHSLKGFVYNTDAKAELDGILAENNVKNVVIVCGVAFGDGEVAGTVGKYLKDKGYRVLVFCFYPRSMYARKFIETADKDLAALRSLDLDGVMIIEGERVFSAVSPQSLIPDLMLFVDEPIREFVFRISNYDYFKKEEYREKYWKSIRQASYDTEIDEILEDLGVAAMEEDSI